MYAFICGKDKKNKLKCIRKSQLKSINFEEYENCLDGCDYQKDCDSFVNRSLVHNMIKGNGPSRAAKTTGRCFWKAFLYKIYITSGKLS